MVGKKLSNIFRPCIDLYQGKVKQIVGSTLNNNKNFNPTENFSSDFPASHYAELYKNNQLWGGHIIRLGNNHLNNQPARAALQKFPQGFHLGGGMNFKNAPQWLDWGADKIIFTSYLFENGIFLESKLKKLKQFLGRDKIVIDLSCYKSGGEYRVAIDGWQNTTDFVITQANLNLLAQYGSEFLIHAIDKEGKMSGIDLDLINLISRISPLTTVYAGGIKTLCDVDRIIEINNSSKNLIGFTIGSSLDVFGGGLDFNTIVKMSKI